MYKKQTRQILENLTTLLELYSVTSKNIDDFPKFNQIYAEYFWEKFHIRSCVELACLPKNAIVEIEVIAFY